MHDGRPATAIAAVEDEASFHDSDFLSESYEAVSGFGYQLHQTGSESRHRSNYQLMPGW
jgi:hypothetical protein